MQYILGVDLGTSATKTILFDEKLQPIQTASAEYPLLQPQNGWAEQHPSDWRQAVFSTIKQVIATSGVSKEDIIAIGLSGQMHGLVMLDTNNESIRPAIIWCDQRTTAECDEITARIGKQRLIEITANPALTGFTAAKILWVRKHEPDNYARCRHILLPKDYIRFCLSGEYATEVSDASGMQLLDVPQRCWSEEILQKLEIDKNLLGKVYESPEVTGTLTKTAAKSLGLTEKTIVVGGAGDNAAAAIGTGTVRPGKAFTTIGTSGVVFAHTDRPLIDSHGRLHTFCHAVPNAWAVMGCTLAAGGSLKWFLDNLCEVYRDEAKRNNIDFFTLVNKHAANVPIGSRKLFYLPYLMGERSPILDPDARGVFFGLSGIHTREDMLRAVMEGVTYSLRDCQQIFEKMNVKFTEMLACGGGGQSALWRQMLADMYNCPVATCANKEGGAGLGAAILAAVGAKLYPSVQACCDARLQIAQHCKPIAANHHYYKKGHQTYQQLYKNLAAVYKDLAAL